MMLALATVAASCDDGEAEPPPAPEVTALASFGSGLGSGSTVGPDGALYVTDGNAGGVVRVDPASGDTTPFAEGLPPQVMGIGGAMDLAFIDDTAYVLVTLVGGDILDGDHIGDDVSGIYRLEDDGAFTVIADIGAWSVDHPPATDFFITTGVHYAMEATGDGLLITDGHHNRVLRVGLDGDISEMGSFENVVPTGLETSGDTVYMGQAGPLPHQREDGRVLELGPDSSTATEVAAGASMIVDIEFAGKSLYALSQGEWDGVQEGSPASPDTGRLLAVGEGGLTPMLDGSGEEIVLDRPTSLEFIGETAYIVTFAGEVLRIDNIPAVPDDTSS